VRASDTRDVYAIPSDVFRVMSGDPYPFGGRPAEGEVSPAINVLVKGDFAAKMFVFGRPDSTFDSVV
jgi:hypothetical protein